MHPRSVFKSLSTASSASRALHLAILLAVVAPARLSAQDESPDEGPETAATASNSDLPLAPADRVDVAPVVRDEEIGARLTRIFEATRWYDDPTAEVREGVVFLAGRTADEEYRQWAGDLARKTEGVVAVVNRIEVQATDPWDFSDVNAELAHLARASLRSMPFFVLGVIVLLIAWSLSSLARRLLRQLLHSRVKSRLLREVAARTLSLLVFLLGLYFVLRISGLTRLAASVIGGTGIVGLVLGIAFRDITENFLASLFLSLQQPFRVGDLVEVTETTGYVQRLTSRTTVLMTLDGTQVQVPNSVVFKNSIRNYTSNPKRREDFVIGIGYDDDIPNAQEVALQVLADHPAVLADPEPWVLVDKLGASTVNLRVYFWIDGSQHSWLKVRSSVIRLLKLALQRAGVSMPDEARELIFPQGVPVRMLSDTPSGENGHPPRACKDHPDEEVTTRAEASLKSEAEEIREQADRAWTPDSGENLLATDQ